MGDTNRRLFISLEAVIQGLVDGTLTEEDHAALFCLDSQPIHLTGFIIGERHRWDRLFEDARTLQAAKLRLGQILRQAEAERRMMWPAFLGERFGLQHIRYLLSSHGFDMGTSREPDVTFAAENITAWLNTLGLASRITVLS
jgi:hypothetical protein